MGSWFPEQELKLCPPEVEAQNLNHWTTQEVPIIPILKMRKLRPKEAKELAWGHTTIK